MKLGVYRITGKDNHKIQITNINYDQNSMSILKKIIKSNLHQIKPKQNKLTYASLEKIRDLSSMQLGNRSTKKMEKRQRLEKKSIFEIN